MTEDMTARWRLGVLKLAEKLGNVSEACRRRGMHRSQFYAFRRRFRALGPEGLKDLPTIPKSHPMTTPAEVVARILDLSLAHPSWGCVRLAAALGRTGTKVSSPTIQNILIKHGLAGRRDRWVRLEDKLEQGPLPLSEEQTAFVERLNPAFRERRSESSRPGELLCQETFSVGGLRGPGRLLLHVVIDTYSSYAFGRLRAARRPETAAELLRSDVLPFYRAKGLAVATILTNGSAEFCGPPDHPYERCLRQNGIEHRRRESLQPNGFVERFRNTILGEFLQEGRRDAFCPALGPLQADLDRWLRPYNLERPQQGYRNRGKRPMDCIDRYVESLRRTSRKESPAPAIRNGSKNP